MCDYNIQIYWRVYNRVIISRKLFEITSEQIVADSYASSVSVFERNHLDNNTRKRTKLN